MPTILCYGDSNTWGAVPQPQRGAGGRFGRNERWPGVLRRHWADGAVEVCEEGLNGRTTCVDDPVEGRHKNGRAYLQVALETHAPLDLVIIMLGTNDLKARLSMPAADIADGAAALGRLARQSGCGPDGGAPAVLLVCPPPLARLGWLAEMFDGAAAKSAALADRMGEAARRESLAFFDAGSVIRCSDVDGIHLDAASHDRLGRALADAASQTLGDGMAERGRGAIVRSPTL